MKIFFYKMAMVFLWGMDYFMEWIILWHGLFYGMDYFMAWAKAAFLFNYFMEWAKAAFLFIELPPALAEGAINKIFGFSQNLYIVQI